MLYLPHAAAAQRMTTDELRAHFLVSDLFVSGAIALRLVDLDRVVLGGVVPLTEPLRLEAPEALRANAFCERRELGVLNTGGAGHVMVDGTRHDMLAHEVLYVGRGTTEVAFASADASAPARYYLVSYPAHASYPTRLMRAQDADVLELGSTERANKRLVRRYIHAGGAASCQLVMGVTTLEPGSVWNTMPTHTHARRTEVYLYFGLPRDAMVVHLMGEPTETRSLIVRDGDVALSPGWSIHSGCGTEAYAFCWAMGGENQDYADMQMVGMEEIR
ncbi:MAG: 5-dehydro-4-deoxy-D-glucuronate isomerase [Gemmatimonadaceae bacterium]|nr:5-dehydro-4-deoxy-D-glucuronate isomerase [Gemmatimonadaceae bacterium]